MNKFKINSSFLILMSLSSLLAAQPAAPGHQNAAPAAAPDRAGQPIATPQRTTPQSNQVSSGAPSNSQSTVASPPSQSVPQPNVIRWCGSPPHQCPVK